MGVKDPRKGLLHRPAQKMPTPKTMYLYTFVPAQKAVQPLSIICVLDLYKEMKGSPRACNESAHATEKFGKVGGECVAQDVRPG